MNEYEECQPLISKDVNQSIYNSHKESSHKSLSSREDSKDKDIEKYNVLNTFYIFFFPALGGLLFGYDIGGTSAVLSQLTSDYAGVSWSSTVENSSILQGFITSISMLGGLLGSMTCFRIADDLGRKRTLLLASIFYFVGALIEFFSEDSRWSKSGGISILILGRIIYGYGFGFAMHGAPAYIGEMAPASIRGLLVSLKEVFIVLGMVLGYSIGYLYSETTGGWKYTYLWTCVFSFLMFFGMFQLPFSARWLALHGRINEAKESLRFVLVSLSANQIEQIRELALKSANNNKLETFQEVIDKFRSPAIFPALVAGIGLVILQQVTGQPSVLYYTVTILTDLGVNANASIIIALFKLIMTSITTFTVDFYGRKKLLLIGCSFMFIALIILVFAFAFGSTSFTSNDDDYNSTCNTYTNTTSCEAAGTYSYVNRHLTRHLSTTLKCSWDSSSCGSYDDCISNGFADNDCSCCVSSSSSTSSSWSTFDITVLLCLFMYIGGYQIGFGPISWLMISEIFPLEIRGKAVSLAVIMNFLFNMIIALLFPVESEYLGLSLTFLIFDVLLIYAIYFILHYVPETKGMTLEEIENYFLSLSTNNNKVKYDEIPVNKNETMQSHVPPDHDESIL